jgi:hypothetical protein
MQPERIVGVHPLTATYNLWKQECPTRRTTLELLKNLALHLELEQSVADARTLAFGKLDDCVIPEIKHSSP